MPSRYEQPGWSPVGRYGGYARANATAPNAAARTHGERARRRSSWGGRDPRGASSAGASPSDLLEHGGAHRDHARRGDDVPGRRGGVSPRAAVVPHGPTPGSLGSRPRSRWSGVWTGICP